MPENPNEVESGATNVRSSIMYPRWMEARVDAIAERTFSSRAQVIRRFIAEGLEREAGEPVEAVS